MSTTGSQRLRVLMSAYACEPNKGSEPEVGWQWALRMARFHEVTVVTRANNRENIETALRERKQEPAPRFVYHDCGPVWLKLKRAFGATQLYYSRWQRSARALIASLHRENQFDLMHHVTFAAYRYPAAIWNHGVPSVWGPVGGAETVPLGLLPWGHPASLAREGIRNLNTQLQSSRYYRLPARARASTCILASTSGMHHVLTRLGVDSQIMPTIGLNPDEIPFTRKSKPAGPLKLLYVGNVIALKGLDLALDALKQSGVEFHFVIVGAGNYLASLRRQTQALGLGERVVFRGRLPREQALSLYADFNLFIFPSLHDTGGYAVLEAMVNELPVLCLDCGGPAIAVAEGCGTKVPALSRGEIVAGMVTAFQTYDRNRELLETQGRAARISVLSRYDWAVKAEAMNEVYRRAAGQR